jgi:hypothetical protein
LVFHFATLLLLASEPIVTADVDMARGAVAAVANCEGLTASRWSWDGRWASNAPIPLSFISTFHQVTLPSTRDTAGYAKRCGLNRDGMTNGSAETEL